MGLRHKSSHKSPAFQFYPADWLSDANVQLMDLATEGAYIRAICYCWREGHIPSDPEELQQLIGKEKLDSKQMAKLQNCFQIDPETDGKLFHPRLKLERSKQRKNSKIRAISGKLGAEKRWKNSDGKCHDFAIAKNSLSSSSSSTKDLSLSNGSVLTHPVEKASNPLKRYGNNVLLTEKQYKKLLRQFTIRGLSKEEHLKEALAHFDVWLEDGNQCADHAKAILGIPLRRVMENESARLDMQRKQELLKRVK